MRVKSISSIMIASLLLGFSALVTSCDKDDEPTKEAGLKYTVMDLKIYVLNEQGQNLLDPSVEHNIRSQEITATFNGKTYYLNEGGDDVFTNNKALSLGMLLIDGSSIFQLGFDGFIFKGGFSKEEVIINWGDGTEDILNLSPGEKIKLNGEEVEHTAGNFIIRKKQAVPADINYRPFRFRIYTEHSPGQAILNFKGVDYVLGTKGIFYLVAEHPIYGEHYRFRDIPVDETLINEPLTITWKDGHQDVVHLNNYIDETGRLIRTITMNGKFCGSREHVYSKHKE